MPNLGLDRYIVFIANITYNNDVTINCFLFQMKNGRELPIQHGKFEILNGNSPLRLNEEILQNVHGGAESFNKIPNYEGEMNYGKEKKDFVHPEKIETSCFREHTIVEVKEHKKEKSNRQSQKSVHHSACSSSTDEEGTPLSEVGSRVNPPRFVEYGTRDSKQRNTYKSDCRTGAQTNQRDLPQKTTGHKHQSTSGSNLPPTLQAGQRQQKQTVTATITDLQITKYDNQTTVGHNAPTQRKNKTLERTQKERDVKKDTHENSKSLEARNEGKQQLHHVNPTAPARKTDNQPAQTTTVEFIGTESQAQNVIVKQPESTRYNRKRKSMYDNVKDDNDSPQPKSRKPSKDSLAPPTPSGIFTPDNESTPKFPENEESRDIVKSGSSWSSLFNSMCCGMRKLSISAEPTVERIKPSSNTGKDNSGGAWV
jgi:hypothetical protein